MAYEPKDFRQSEDQRAILSWGQPVGSKSAMANPAMDIVEWHGKQQEETETDLPGKMMGLIAGMLLAARVAAICGADRRERTEERVHSRNGRHQRPWVMRMGGIDSPSPS